MFISRELLDFEIGNSTIQNHATEELLPSTYTTKLLVEASTKNDIYYTSRMLYELVQGTVTVE